MRAPRRFRWTLHNVLAHPISEVLFQIGAHGLSEWVHDVTVPKDAGPSASQECATCALLAELGDGSDDWEVKSDE